MATVINLNPFDKSSAVSIEPGELVLFALDGAELCRHKIASGKGLKILNNDHKRDKSSVINEMIEQIALLFENPKQGKEWMASVRTAKPRYIRDQLLMTKKIIEDTTEPSIITKALDYCIENKITSANDLKAVVMQYKQQEPKKEYPKIIRLNPLGGALPDGAMVQPDKSQIEDYRTILENNQHRQQGSGRFYE